MFTVEYKKLPNFNHLFLDYISPEEENYKKLKPFFNAHFRENEEFFKVIDEKVHNYNTNRYFDKNTLIDILKRQNMALGADEKTVANIELLKREDTFAAVTGQQVGLYTGNLYTILKTITAVKLANNLKERFPQFNFVPVFWLESDDHDLEESNHINLVNKQNELVRIGFEDEIIDENDPSKKNAQPVGGKKFDNTITEINSHLKNALIDTDFKEKLIDKINSFYHEGNDYKTAFGQFMSWLFSEYGVVFIDPDDAEIKKLLTPVFEKELTTSPKLCEAVIRTSAELEKNYDLQVKPKVINLFFLHKGNRLLI